MQNDGDFVDVMQQYDLYFGPHITVVRSRMIWATHVAR